ncbi:MAG TPA: D-lyxose/D-mannose family sugar isomerase, partial [Candidatus Hydrogenedens sp.]|nr:D-lyxose/D-mannose family sugar isomerase [Candidatus Hydrogenedens sp.]
MLKKSDIEFYRGKAAEMLAKCGIVITPSEKESIEIVDLGFGRFEELGLAILVYVNTDRYCAKELIMFPRMICSEHKHPPVGDQPGKMETFR